MQGNPKTFWIDGESATMGLIYECTQRVIEEINHIEDVDHIMLGEIRGMCMQRWTMLHLPLHATAFILHPIRVNLALNILSYIFVRHFL